MTASEAHLWFKIFLKIPECIFSLTDCQMQRANEQMHSHPHRKSNPRPTPIPPVTVQIHISQQIPQKISKFQRAHGRASPRRYHSVCLCHGQAPLAGRSRRHRPPASLLRLDLGGEGKGAAATALPPPSFDGIGEGWGGEPLPRRPAQPPPP